MTISELRKAMPDLASQGFITHRGVLDLMVDIGMFSEEDEIDREWIELLVVIPEPKEFIMPIGQNMYRTLDQFWKDYAKSKKNNDN
jgi:hypothetical protein